MGLKQEPHNHERTRAEKKEAYAKRRALQAIDGPKAMAEYVAAEYAVREKTARLRALRLARDVE